ncbi:MAG: hypothetical protein OCD01_14550 [Fibrobacterales bacterium]
MKILKNFTIALAMMGALATVSAQKKPTIFIQKTQISPLLRVVGEKAWWQDTTNLAKADNLVISTSGSAATLMQFINRVTGVSKLLRFLDPTQGSYNAFKALPTLLHHTIGLESNDHVSAQAIRIASESHESNVFALATRPTFSFFKGVGDMSDIDDGYFHPTANQWALRIAIAMGRITNPDKKLILIGKSMGGCQMYKAANKLKKFNVTVDALILVDASCEVDDHSGSRLPVNDNVKRAYSFFQRKAGEKQKGYSISETDPLRFNRDVNKTGFCDNVGHGQIDTCDGVLDYITNIGNAILR